jgi:glycine cleavage system H lipoate-binding protein
MSAAVWEPVVVWSPAALSASSTVLSGKRKHGSSSIAAGDLLCTVTTDRALSFRLTAGVGGRLLEVNEKLIANPSLLSNPRSSQWEGYIALVLMDKQQLHELQTAGAATRAESARSASSNRGSQQQRQQQPVWRSTAEWEQIRGGLSSTNGVAASLPSTSSPSYLLNEQKLSSAVE